MVNFVESIDKVKGSGMLFTDEDLFGVVQLDIFEALADAEVVEDVPVVSGVDYGDEPGVIDLFGAGQCALAGV